MKGLHINGDERKLLWALLNEDAMESVHAIITDGNISTGERAVRVVRQMDYIFQVRLVVANTPESGGGLWFSDLAIKYLESILTETHIAQLSLEHRTLWYKYAKPLLFKLSDVDRVNVGFAEAALKKPQTD